MSLDQHVRELMLRWIRTYVDQLAEEVVDYYDSSSVANCYGGGGQESYCEPYVYEEVQISYRVHEDVTPAFPGNIRRYRHTGSMVQLITDLSELESRSE